MTAGHLVLHRAVFAKRVVIEVATPSFPCTEARFQAGVTLRLRHATTAMEGAVFGAPSAIISVRQPFTNSKNEPGAADFY